MMLLHMEIAEQTADWRGTRFRRGDTEMLRQTSEGDPGFRKRETDSQTLRGYPCWYGFTLHMCSVCLQLGTTTVQQILMRQVRITRRASTCTTQHSSIRMRRHINTEYIISCGNSRDCSKFMIDLHML